MKTIKGIFVLTTVLLIALPALAQEKKAEQEQPDQQAMMEMMEKLGAPGDMHEKLEPFIGKFDVEAKFWMGPDTEPMSSKGKASYEWILGGRYVAQHYEGDFMGQTFNGMGVTGYDNYKKEYVSTWIDSMSTTLMITKGSVDGSTFTFTGTMDDPMSGTSPEVTEKIVVHSEDHHVMEMWVPTPDGKPFKNMEIHYRRVK